jgi:pyruvate dehydrogenase E1 component beta subunit
MCLQPHTETAETLSFGEAILHGTAQLMERHPEVFVIGEGVDDYRGIWETTLGLARRFGAERVVDIPIAENGLTGIAIGASLVGFRPIFVHARIDFTLMAMDALCNHAAKWHAMTGFQQRCPITVRAILGRGWGQSVQHAQSFYPVFAHFPGIKVVAPFGPRDAKGLLASAVLDDDPVIIVESRSLYGRREIVPREFYTTPIGEAEILQEGKDITLVGVSWVLDDVLAAAEALRARGVSAEVINLRSIKPLDMETIGRSVAKTRNLVVADISWEYFNLAGEIASRITETHFDLLDRPPLRVALPDQYVGASERSERNYYISGESLLERITRWMEARRWAVH